MGDTLGNHPWLAVSFKVKLKGTDSVPTDSSGKTHKGRPWISSQPLPSIWTFPPVFLPQHPYPDWDLGGSGLVAESCLTLATHGLCWAPLHGILQAGILDWLAFPSPGDLPTQESNPGLLHCRELLHWLRHQGNLGWDLGNQMKQQAVPSSPGLMEDPKLCHRDISVFPYRTLSHL